MEFTEEQFERIRKHLPRPGATSGETVGRC